MKRTGHLLAPRADEANEVVPMLVRSQTLDVGWGGVRSVDESSVLGAWSLDFAGARGED